MSNLQLMNMLGEIINVADIVGGDFPAGLPQTAGPLTYTLPSNTPSGQNGQSVLQLGNVSTNEIYSKNTEFWSGCPGIVSLPALPTSSSDACQVIYLNRNNQNIGFAYRDTRYNANSMQAGETLLFSPIGSGKIKLANDGTVTMGTDASVNGKCYVQTNENGIYFVTPWGTMSLDANGFNVTVASGASINMGGLASGLPVAALTSFVNINASMFNAAATTVSLGVGPVFANACVPITAGAPNQFGVPLPLFTTTCAPSILMSVV